MFDCFPSSFPRCSWIPGFYSIVSLNGFEGISWRPFPRRRTALGPRWCRGSRVPRLGPSRAGCGRRRAGDSSRPRPAAARWRARAPGAGRRGGSRAPVAGHLNGTGREVRLPRGRGGPATRGRPAADTPAPAPAGASRPSTAAPSTPPCGAHSAGPHSWRGPACSSRSTGPRRPLEGCESRTPSPHKGTAGGESTRARASNTTG